MIKIAEPYTEDVYFADEDGEGGIGLADIILALPSLKTRQRFVIECRYGLRAGSAGERASARELGSLMGISHQRVLKIEAQALKALRRTLGVAE